MTRIAPRLMMLLPMLLLTPLTTGQAVQSLLGPDGGPCVICHEDCPVGEHIAANGGYTLPLTWQRNGGAHNGLVCLPGTCASRHGPEGCGAAMLRLPEFRDLDDAVRMGREGEVRQLATAYRSQIELNVSRSALQVRDCEGQLIAHLPLPQPMLDALME
jgi:hypothetical protein